jgi:hypothetical protein
MTVVGLRANDVIVAACTASVAVFVLLLYVAEMVAEVFAPTGWEFTVKIAVVAAAGTVTLPGAGMLAADGLLLDSVTVAPPVDAGPLSVTVPVELLPPSTLAGFNVNAVTVGRETSFCNMIATAVPLPTAKSSLPSPLKSPARIPTGPPIVAIWVELGKVPSPAP